MRALRDKSDAPAEFGVWAAKVENGTGSTIEAVMFDNTKELLAGRMREYCEHKGVRINSWVPYSPSSNGVAERLVGVATIDTRAMLRDSKALPRFWAQRQLTPSCTCVTGRQQGRTKAQLHMSIVYGMKPDVGHVRTFWVHSARIWGSWRIAELLDTSIRVVIVSGSLELV